MTPEAAYAGALTLGAFRELTRWLPDDTPLVVAVRDSGHFDTLLADLKVSRASITHGPRTSVVVIDVPGIT